MTRVPFKQAKGALSAERVAALEALGFGWEHPLDAEAAGGDAEALYEAMVARLEAFREEVRLVVAQTAPCEAVPQRSLARLAPPLTLRGCLACTKFSRSRTGTAQ